MERAAVPPSARTRASIGTLGRKAGRTHMKKLLLIGALAATALMYSQPSHAYFRGKWCAKVDSGAGVVGERCDFPNFETCRSYINAYPKSFCVQNQWRADNWGITSDRVEERFNRIYR
jgi:hypothetical protein